ncbi:MAG: hypothetical protein QXI10_02325 [Candidatus Diapherotrites archaeon]
MPIISQEEQTTNFNPNTIDYGKIIVDSLKSIITSSASQKFYMVNVLFNLLLYSITFLGVLSFFSGLGYNNQQEQMTQKIIEIIITNITNPMNLTQTLFGIFLLFLAIVIVVSGINYYIIGWGISKILEELEGTQKNFGLLTWAKLLVLNIWKVIVAFTSLLDKKFLMVFIGIIFLSIGSVVLMIMTRVNPMFALIASLLFILVLVLGIIYFFIIIYNLLRLHLVQFYLIDNNEKGVIESTKKTWEITKGKVSSMLVLIVIIIIISFLINLPLSFINGIIELLFFNSEAKLILQIIFNLISILIESYLTVFNLNAMARFYLAIKE